MTNYLKYKSKMAVLDADDTEIESWITVKGNHIPIKKGQSKEEAVKSFLESKGGNSSSKATGQKIESSSQWKPDDKLNGWLKQYLSDVKSGYGWVDKNKVLLDIEEETGKDLSKDKEKLFDYMNKNGWKGILKNGKSDKESSSKEDEKLWEQAYKNVREKDDDTDPSGFYRPTDFMSPTELRDYHEKQEKDIQAEYERLKNGKSEVKSSGEQWKPDDKLKSWLKQYLSDVKSGEGWVDKDKVLLDIEEDFGKDLSKNKTELFNYMEQNGWEKVLKTKSQEGTSKTESKAKQPKDIMEWSFNDVMQLPVSDPRVHKYIAKNNGLSINTVSTMAEGFGSTEDLYFEIDRISDRKGYGWDKIKSKATDSWHRLWGKK